MPNIYPDIDSFKDATLSYLLNERELIKQDIEEHKALSPEEREEMGLIIRNAMLIEANEHSVKYSTLVNNTKLRPGDDVWLREPGSNRRLAARVNENGIEELDLYYPSNLTPPKVVDIEIDEVNLLDGIIELVSSYRAGSPGLRYLSALSGIREPKEIGLGAIKNIEDGDIPSSFNESQKDAVMMSIKRPGIAYIQGIPGSGKTQLLSVVAKIYTKNVKDVVVMALTHQAVNNALNKIASLDSSIPIYKIGKPFKNIGLSNKVIQAESFNEYLDAIRRLDSSKGRVVGMTFHAALTNLGRRNTFFTPQVILFDEAGQMPLTHAAAIGTFNCGSIIFIGDDIQMPPIYHGKLIHDDLSISIFERIKELYPDRGEVLNVTYRMNTDLANFISERFYKPQNITFESSKVSKGNTVISSKEPWLKIHETSIFIKQCICTGATDENEIEAEEAVIQVENYLKHGLSVDRMAVITPYRRQVRLIHKKMIDKFGHDVTLPLVDTVERLQGQDVDVIIVSFCVDDVKFFTLQQSFILQLNRLNVMFSRATSRVIILASSQVIDMLGLDCYKGEERN